MAMKLKKMWLKTPVGEEQAAQAVLDPAIGEGERKKGTKRNREIVFIYSFLMRFIDFLFILEMPN